MPMPLSSQRKMSGIGEPWNADQPAVLNAPCAVEWFADASPKLASTTASPGSGQSVNPCRRAMPIEKAAPTALGRCEAIVEVCGGRSEEHTSELQSLMRISYDVFCLKKKKQSI